MSKYTTEVRFICENLDGREESADRTSVNSIIENVWDKIFDFYFPIFDEKYRKPLCTKIIKHYYTREIGLETVGLWKLKLEVKMNEIMPYYNKLYETELIEINPLNTNKLTKTHSGNNTSNLSGTDSGTSNSNGTSYSLFSDTPQGSLQNLETNAYLTNVTKGTSEGTSSSSTSTKRSGTSTDEFTETIEGYNGYIPSELIEKYRKILLNIDMQIINELEELFMQLW